MNIRKRKASDEYPTTSTPSKSARLTQSSNMGLVDRWKDVCETLSSLFIDTASHFIHHPSQIQPKSTSTSTSLFLDTDSSNTTSQSSSQPSSSSLEDRSSLQRQTLPQPRFSSAKELALNGPGGIQKPHIPDPRFVSTRNSALNGRQDTQKPIMPHPPFGSTRKLALNGPQGIRKPYKPHRHVHADLHRNSVQEFLKREIYNMKRAQGYSADFATFKSFLEYQHQVNQVTHPTKWHSDNFSTRKPTGLSSRTEPATLNTVALQQALARARDSLSGPGPLKAFVPTFEQLKVKEKQKDNAIELRLHPPLPAKLSKDEQIEVNRITSNPKFVTKAGRESVNAQDLQRLQPGKWLNDELINFYGQLIVDRSLNDEAGKENVDVGQPVAKRKWIARPLRVHYFNTFYWPKMQEGYVRSNLRKWTKKVDIFTKDLVLLPINHNQMHWSAAVINFKRKRLESYDSLDNNNLRNERLFDILRSYLREEYRDKKGKEFDFAGWQNFARPDTPQQENGYDCGVFTTQFLESAARGEEGFAFSQQDTPYLRQRMILEIGQAKLCNQHSTP